jgi:hypothetical protein
MRLKSSPFLWVPCLLMSIAGCYPLDAKHGQELLARYPDRVEQWFEQLDFELPVLGYARQAYDAGDHAETLHRLLVYFRAKPVPPSVHPDLPPGRADILALADDAMEDIFTIQSRTYKQPRLPNGKLDWDDFGPNRDKEWAWMMNRHQHFLFLVTAFRYTGNSRYVETVSDHLIDWIPTHPAPDHISFSTSWRALEAARRVMETWMAAYIHLKAQPDFSDEALFLLLSSIPEHANTLSEHYSFWGGNHKMTEKLAIVICGLVWYEFRDSRRWLQTALDKTTQELFAQTYPDGSYKELANHYQKIVSANYLRLMSMVRGKPFSPGAAFEERVEAMWNYFCFVSRPSGFGPLNSDSSLEENLMLVEEANQFFKRSDWDYIVSQETRGTPPEDPPSRYFPWAGHAVMRDGWGADAQWAFYDIGPHGSAHQHDDRLHLSVSLGVWDLLVDTGRYTYLPGALREFFKRGAGHNVVRVAGRDSVVPPHTVAVPLPNYARIQHDHDVFQASVQFHLDWLQTSKVTQTRTVIYLRSVGWLVVDAFVGYGRHRFDTQWQFHPDCIVSDDEAGLHWVLPDGKTGRMDLITLRQGDWDLARGQLEPEVRGWYSWAYNERRPATSARYTQRSGGPFFNLWWLRPADASGQLAELEVVHQGRMRSVDDAMIRVKSSIQSWEISFSQGIPTVKTLESDSR